MTLYQFQIPHCPHVSLDESLVVDWEFYFHDRFTSPNQVILADIRPNCLRLMPCAIQYTPDDLESELLATSSRAYILSDSPMESKLLAVYLREKGYNVRVLDSEKFLRSI